ncbi:MAG TPA: glycosyltransferase family 4 protein [Candidatus Sulfotelmatobacter sp.]|jgi:glycosyltransferase involved in cell wall biosynthesis|nr:glycosyltransferase family 4 protein [Candidatus Sulfotelmatobacter sp.]
MSKINSQFTIGIIQQSPDMGGAETYMLSLLEQFLKEDVVIFLASNKEKFLAKAKELPIKTFEIPFILDIIGNYRGLIKSFVRLPYALLYYTFLLKTYKKNNVDVILMSGFSEKMLVTFLSLFINIPIVWIEYGRLEIVFCRNFYLPKTLYKLLQSIPKKIIVPSKNTHEGLLDETQVSLSKLVLLPLGIPIKEKRNISKASVDPILKGKFIIGNISRLTTEKGQDYLIKAMPSIIKKYPQTHLLIVGSGPDKDFYQRIIEQLYLEDYITITGYVNNLAKYYECMDIFIFPTIWELEGFGLVNPEAMSYRLPIIASRLGPVPEIVEDGVTGLLVPPKNSEAIAEAVIQLINNPKKRKYLGENGYKKARKLYDIEINSEKVLTVLKS